MCEDPTAESGYDATVGTMAATTQNLPAFLKVVGAELLPYLQKQLEASQVVSPGYNDLATKLYEDSAPRLATTGANVDRINRTGAAETDLAILRGSGGQLSREGQAIDKDLNPEFYATRSASADKLGQLLNSINLNNANPEAERLVNQESLRTGNIGTDSSTQTVSNALEFGNQLQKRRDALGAALSQATNFLAPSQSQFNPVVTALNRSTTNTGENRFAGVKEPGDQALTAGTNVLGTATALKQQSNDINANRRDALDRINESVSAL